MDTSQNTVFKSPPARVTLAGLVLALAIALGALETPRARAQSPAPVYVPIALTPLQRDTPLELVALTLDADITESGGHTLVSGNSTFKIHNTDRLNDLQVAVGFPSWAGDPYAFDPTRLVSFSVSIDGQKVRTLTPAHADLKIGSVVRAVDWYTFTLAIAGDEKKTVRFDFDQDLGDGALPRFAYGLMSATDWKGSIGSARLTLRFPEMTTLEQIVATGPANPDFDGTSVTWRFTTHEPAANPALTFLRPSLWDDLNAKRRAAQQNSNDANAHTALGNALRALALIDSPQRDSFYTQAVAELETAARIDPNQRAARQGLGALYESRAGPASGPRQATYVSLAVAQWEALAASDANARKQLAEDYFYLGLDAQTRRAFADAAADYAQAQSLAPNGAGPLYMPDRLAAQRRALNIAWAGALLEQSDAATAKDKARAALGEAFMSSFGPPPFYVTRAQVSMSANSRSMVFVFAPFAASPAELQNQLSGAAAQLRAVGADASFDVAQSLFNVDLPYESQADLIDRLAALAQALPNRTEWAVVRAVLSPKNLTWEEADEVVTHATRYREDVDLSPACAEFVAQMDAVSQSLKPLENAPATDAEAQLKRALLKYAQSGWQAALAQSDATYRVGSNQAHTEACAARAVAISASTFLPGRVALIVGAIELAGIGILVVRWRRNRQRSKGAQEQGR
ncbi:MAG: hypothetical protein KGJ80_10720 [Chloroflexota bacterium]|nr:hypothetical protein [Chloroflexota bacterium]